MNIILRPHFNDHYFGILIEEIAFNNNSQFSFIDHVLHTHKGK